MAGRGDPGIVGLLREMGSAYFQHVACILDHGESPVRIAGEGDGGTRDADWRCQVHVRHSRYVRLPILVGGEGGFDAGVECCRRNGQAAGFGPGGAGYGVRYCGAVGSAHLRTFAAFLQAYAYAYAYAYAGFERLYYLTVSRGS